MRSQKKNFSFYRKGNGRQTISPEAVVTAISNGEAKFSLVKGGKLFTVSSLCPFLGQEVKTGGKSLVLPRKGDLKRAAQREFSSLLNKGEVGTPRLVALSHLLRGLREIKPAPTLLAPRPATHASAPAPKKVDGQAGWKAYLASTQNQLAA
ncbi:MAG: hypothetical protein V1770_01380 [bacterium]